MSKSTFDPKKLDPDTLSDAEKKTILRIRDRLVTMKQERAETDSARVAVAYATEADGKTPWLYKRRLIVVASKKNKKVWLTVFNSDGDQQFTTGFDPEKLDELEAQAKAAEVEAKAKTDKRKKARAKSITKKAAAEKAAAKK